jgi:zinc transport system substrate-binding protein
MFQRHDHRSATPRPLRVSVLLATVIAAGVTACGSDTTGAAGPVGTAGGSGRTVAVSAAFYPIAEAATRVGGDRVEVQNLTPPGSEPHDLEFDPRQQARLSESRVVFYLSESFQPAVEKAVATLPPTVHRVDLLAGAELAPASDSPDGPGDDHAHEDDGDHHGHAEDGLDPHLWVSPAGQALLAQRIHDELVTLDPEGRPTYDAGLASYQEELHQLDAEFEHGLAACRTRAMVTSHQAFGYLARRYDLTQIPIAGLSPGEEPDPRTLVAVAEAARANGAEVVFFEKQVPPDLAETIAREIGARTDALDPVETITAADLARGATYTSVMRDNLTALRAGLDCR